MKIVKLSTTDGSKYHIGNYRRDLMESFTSDQLFSAVINNLSLIASRNEIDKEISMFEQGDITISSLFFGFDIVSKNERFLKRSIFFLPSPQGEIGLNNTDKEIILRKMLKKVSFFSLDAYKKILSTWDGDEGRFKFNPFDLIIVGKNFACTINDLKNIGINLNPDDKKKLERIRIIGSSTVPGLTINRFTSDSEFFYEDYSEIHNFQFDDILFKPFFYFIYKGILSEQLKTAINLLPEQGIGGKRSKGMGFFEGIDWIDERGFDILSQTGKYHITLSSVYPEEDDVNVMVNYKLRKKDGYLYSGGGQPFRKRSVRLISEGSIFSSPVKGRLVKVTPKNFPRHDVYLNGKAFLLSFGGEI